MPQCCRCNGSGRCANCACVKAKKPCTNCLPGRKARCSNTNTAVLPCPPPLNQPPGPGSEVDGPTSGVDALPRDVQPSPPPPSQSSGPVSEEDDPTNGDALPRDVEGATSEAQGLSWSLLSGPTIQPTVQLPEFLPTANPAFTWESQGSESFSHSLNAMYAEVVHWKMNYFKVPYGNTRKSFVSELARLFTPLPLAQHWNPLHSRQLQLCPSYFSRSPPKIQKRKTT